MIDGYKGMDFYARINQFLKIFSPKSNLNLAKFRFWRTFKVMIEYFSSQPDM